MKYLPMIKSNDEFDKIVAEAMLKHGYRIVKVGSGNFITNPSKFRDAVSLVDEVKEFRYQVEKCSIC